jgi:Flp pilus assembly protein TadG
MHHSRFHRTGRLRRAGGESGQGMVEFAFILPLFLLLILGVLDIGKAVSYWQDETHLANEAARYAAVDNSPTKDIGGNPVPNSLGTAIKNSAESDDLKNGGHSISTPGVAITFSFPNGNTKHCIGDPVKVTVTATYNWLQYLAGDLGPSTSVTATSTMRLEQNYRNDTSDSYTASASGTCS